MKIVFTATDLDKGIVDVPRELQEALAAAGIHDFDAQSPGARPYPTIPCLVDDGDPDPCMLGANRPATKGGAFRRFSRIAALVRRMGIEPGEAIFFSVVGEDDCNRSLAASRDNPRSVLGVATEKSPESTVSNSMPAYDQIRSMSFGKEGSVVNPVDESVDWPPRGPLPPGTQKAIEAFIANVESRSEDENLIVALVGGAGNGKSFAAQRIVSEIGTIDIPRFRAPRLTRLRKANAVIVNDASISSRFPKGGRPELHLDIAEAIRDQYPIWINVNRGILIEEKAYANRSGAFADGEDQTDLVSKDLQELAGRVIARLLGSNASKTEHVGYFRDETISESVRIIVVQMDWCSLLEPTPREGQGYSVNRKSDPPEKRSSSAGCEVLTQTIEDHAVQLRDSLDKNDPLLGNITSLSRPSFRCGLISALRDYEIFNGQPLTYRELWFAISEALLGPIATEEQRAQWLADMSSSQLTPLQRLQEAERLSCFRAHQSIYGANYDEYDLSSGMTPLLSGMRRIDPCLGELNPKIFDAMHSLALEDFPSEFLIGEISGFEDVWTPFDARYEEALMEFLDSAPKEQDRRKHQRRFSDYLIRLASTLAGTTAVSDATGCWKTWHREGTNPSTLKKATLNLLVHRDGSGESSQRIMVPAFATHAKEIDQSPSRPTLATYREFNQLVITSTALGDRLLVGIEGIELAIKGDLLLELWMKSIGAGSFTSRSRTAQPLIDRIRTEISSRTARDTPFQLIRTNGREVSVSAP